MGYGVMFRHEFWKKVKKTSSCWLWTGSKTRLGYGTCWDGEMSRRAHRLSWELEHGPIPDGVDVLHSCDNRACVNPRHLHLGNHRDNMKEMVARGRSAKKNGTLNGRSKLTWDDVRQIRRLYRWRSKDRNTHALAKMFGVGQHTIHRIVSNKGWVE
jgi:hypothetical protein